MSQIRIEKWDKAKDGELNDHNMRQKLKRQGYKFEVCKFGPGTEFEDHSHGEDKRDCVLTGRFQVNVYGKTEILEPGDMVDMPKDVVHSARVIGNEEVILFDAVKE